MKQILRMVVFSCVITVLAHEYQLDIRANHSDAVYKTGETIQFTAKLLEDGKISEDKFIRYTIFHNGKKILHKDVSGKEPISVETKMENPGWCLVIFEGRDSQKVLKSQKGKVEKNVQDSRGALVDPLAIRQGAPEPKDFDAYWNLEKKNLKILSPNIRMKPVPGTPEYSKAFYVTADVGQGFRPMNAILKYPANAKPKSLPAMLFVHGAGVHVPGNPQWSAPLPKDYPVKSSYIFMNLNAHGIPWDQPKEYYQGLAKGELAFYPFINSIDRDKFYMKGMILRLVRALEILKSNPAWDGKNLIVSGGSQGGAQALIAGGIDSQVSFVYADVPAMCDHGGSLVNRSAGWPKLYLKKTDGTFMIAKDYNPVNHVKGDASIVKTSGYFDAANFAKRIHGTAYLRAGGYDNVCPPPSVFSAYNNIPSKEKHIIFSSRGGHCQGIYYDTDQQKIAEFQNNEHRRKISEKAGK